jgi:hypothetical protein
MSQECQELLEVSPKTDHERPAEPLNRKAFQASSCGGPPRFRSLSLAACRNCAWIPA